MNDKFDRLNLYVDELKENIKKVLVVMEQSKNFTEEQIDTVSDLITQQLLEEFGSLPSPQEFHKKIYSRFHQLDPSKVEHANNLAKKAGIQGNLTRSLCDFRSELFAPNSDNK